MAPIPALLQPLRPTRPLLGLLSLLLFLSCSTPPSALAAEAALAPGFFEKTVRPTLQEYCFDCHGEGSKKGGVSLDASPLPPSAPSENDRKLWFAVWKNLNAQLMPPSDKPQPGREKIEAVQRWIEQSVFNLHPNQPDPGRVTVRRLNRSEYRNTIRDLTGVDFAVLDHFPNDDTGYGFDTIGEVLSLSPLLFEKYLDAAQAILSSAWKAPAPGSFFGSVPLGPHSPDPATRRSVALEQIRRFASRAFRRPPPPESMDRLVKIYEAAERLPGVSFESALSEALSAILCSPRFLFRSELQPNPDDPRHIQPLDEFALASRLSYFLWNTTPDWQLLQKATDHSLRSHLHAEVDRLIDDPRFHQFVSSFVGQWLQTQDVESVALNPVIVLKIRDFEEAQRTFNPALRHAMRLETETFFEHLVRQNRPATELLNARYTFVNDALAKFYGLPKVAGKQMRQVDLPGDFPRSGVLGHGSFLVVTSNPTRTSPVKRGQFVLENLLGAPSPPPPPNIPPLEETSKSQKTLSMRALMELHRKDALCSSCHARMDPIGLALEDFNAAGQFAPPPPGSEQDRAGVLITGESFQNVRELADLLANRRTRDFYWCVSEKLLTYALGRGVEPYDLPTLRSLVSALEKGPATFRQLLHLVVDSAPFQKRRGNGQKLSAAASDSNREN